ncbi:hypothetical protein O7542_19960 [Micromonospora sp. WMMC264]|uniref:hypothetical protein n=1 Tax=Micromonospora sp. WMMC264 TaxID=3015158 RepID=UPI00248BE3A1|nr:hypothetical protein [Micromonospora sp. WMMC264]WBB83625.1 hypothetical protein O7542_19960 [Micromonospora sp. WMMC264]
MRAIDQYRKTEQTFREAPEPSSLYENIAQVDFELRFLTLCVAGCLRQNDREAVNLGRAPGFGSWTSYLRRFLSLAPNLPSTPAVRIVTSAVSRVLGALDSRWPNDSGLTSLLKLRNHLSHGGPVPHEPDRSALARHVKRVISEVTEAVHTMLADAEMMQGTRTGDSMFGVTLAWPDGCLPLWPFVLSDNAGSWCLLAQFTGLQPVYIRPGEYAPVRFNLADEELVHAIGQSIEAKNGDRAFAAFISDVRADLAGFRDPDFDPYHDEIAGGVAFFWKRATSEGTEDRIDGFRLGPDEARQWKDGTQWQPYSHFLRQLANLTVVARRIRQQLVELYQQLVTEEQTALGWAAMPPNPVESRIRIRDLSGQPAAESSDMQSFDQLLTQIDTSVESRGTHTQVYFVTGEAGIGKTRVLLKAALDRASQIEEGKSPEGPLFLYVSSAGHVLATLPMVVDAAVTATRNLTEAAVRALCRNGLMALFVDGFDELLGGVGYDDALGSLRPWIEDLGGRGVIIVSARSSYYLNQYRSSIQRADGSQRLAVRHQVAEIQRWDKSLAARFLQINGVPERETAVLSEQDRDLLGLPFFARVFLEDVRRRAASRDVEAAAGRPLPQRLIDQYINREIAKLTTPGSKPLLTNMELERMFEYLAQLMADQREREVSVEELRFAASLAINSEDLEVRRGLTNRLSVLCGVAFAGNSRSTEKRFTFQHELFYDQFLANAILEMIRNDKHVEFHDVLASVEWRAATVTHVVRYSAETIPDLMITEMGQTRHVSPERQQTFRKNLGSLWAEVARVLRRLGSVRIHDVEFDVLDLSDVTCGQLTFAHCAINELILPLTPCINFDDCDIETLRVRMLMRLGNVTGLDPERITLLITPQSFCEGTADISRELVRLGVPLQRVAESRPDSQFANHVDVFLSRVISRADSIVVYESDYRSAEEQSGWQHRHGLDVWRDFVRLLVNAGLADLVPITSAGPAKAKVRFKVPPTTIRAEGPDNDNVTAFWSQVRAKP